MIGRAGLVATLWLALACPGVAGETPPERFGFRVVASFPHDPTAFTQGLLYHEGVFYESTGEYGRSTVRRVDPASGRVLQRTGLPASLFGEGLALVGERLVQLTWRAGRGRVYDRGSLGLEREFRYPGEGWGLAFDGARLILSDGSPVLRFLDPKSFRETGRVSVRDGVRPVDRLNELELVEGSLYANVWGSDRIARIDPATGRVTGWVDLTGLLSPVFARPGVDVLNGIAWDAEGRRLFVTGKRWPRLFQIELVPR